MKFIKNSNDIKFDEDLIAIMTIYFKSSGIITQECGVFIKDLSHFIKKNEGITLETFELLNLFLIDGICNSTIEDDFSNILVKYIKTGINDKASSKLSHFLSYNLFCIMIQVK